LKRPLDPLLLFLRRRQSALPRVGGIAVRRVGLFLLLAHATTGRAALVEDEPPTVTPYRPSVSTPAALSVPGWLEVETGLARVGGDGEAWRSSLPYTLKLAFTPDWGIRVGGEALVRAADDTGRSSTGFGDLSVVLKRRFEVSDHVAYGLELGVSSPTARAALHSGSGSTDYSLNAIYSADIGAVHTDLNLMFTRVGTVAAGQGDTQALLALAVSHNLNERWGLVGEFSGIRQVGVAHTAQFLFASSYSPLAALTWDFGVARGLSGASPRWSLFAGATFLLAKLY